MVNKPYKYWSRDNLFNHLVLQCKDYNFDGKLLVDAVYSKKWLPYIDYNGCNFVQDSLHPFYPCFIHDYRWLCFDYDKKYDKEFERNLIMFGYSRFRAKMYYIAVRCGWLFYYKWKKKINKK